MACHYGPWTERTVGQCRTWHAIIALGINTQMDDVGRGMPSSRLERTHSMRRWVWNSMIVLGKHTWSDDIGRDMPSWPLDNTHGRIILCIEFHHSPLTANTNGLCRVWNVIITLEKNVRSDEITHGILLFPFDKTHDQTMSSVACHYSTWIAQTIGGLRAWRFIIALGQHTWSNNVGRGMPS